VRDGLAEESYGREGAPFTPVADREFPKDVSRIAAATN
jgi:hypothetical protein